MSPLNIKLIIIILLKNDNYKGKRICKTKLESGSIGVYFTFTINKLKLDSN